VVQTKTAIERVSVEAELLRSRISGGISLIPGKKLRILHEFKGRDGNFYITETPKVLHTEHVKLSGHICGTRSVSDGRTYIRLDRCTIRSCGKQGPV